MEQSLIDHLREAQTRHAIYLVLVLLTSALYLREFVFRGWIPHDEGLLGQTAERVLDGQLPHRDFDDAYTGGLTYLHAGAMRILGHKLTSLRLVLYAFALAFVAAIYLIAAHAVRPWLASLVALSCLVWTVPNYFAGLPSWYVLFFSVFGMLCLLRYIETEKRVWLFAAGLCGGLGILVKSVGVYYVAAGGLFLLYKEQLQAPERTDGRSLTFPIVHTAVGFAFITTVAVLIARFPGITEVAYYVVPSLALGAALVFGEWQETRRVGAAMRLKRLLRAVLPFGAGVVIPVASFIGLYAANGSSYSLWHGVVVLPQERFIYAANPLPSATTLLTLLPYAAILALPPLRRPRETALLLMVLVVALVCIPLAGDDRVYRALFNSARYLLPLGALASAWFLVRTQRDTLDQRARLRVFLGGVMAALLALIQFPYAFGIYFCYVSPFAALAILFVLGARRWPLARVHTAVLVLYTLFATLWLNTGFIRTIGVRWVYVQEESLLLPGRAGLYVPKKHEEVYERLVAEIQAHTPSGSYIYATPDCPQVYFLSEMRNPTPTMYDFFDADLDTPEVRRARLLRTLEEAQVKVVVVNWVPEFTRKLDRRFLQEVGNRFPFQADIPPFTVRWRL